MLVKVMLLVIGLVTLMEIAANSNKGISIRAGDTTIVVDPQKVNGGDVVLFVDASNPLVEEQYEDSTVIHGPGEYETGSFVIHGEAGEKGTFYVIEAEAEKLLLVNASDTKSISSDTRYGTIVVRLDEAFDEGESSSLPGELIVLYGEVTEGLSNITKLDKVGKRKKSELRGQTVLLTK